MNKTNYKKIKPITKQDKQHICKLLDTALTPSAENFPITDNVNWITLLQLMDKESIHRSLAQILNAEFDRLPQALISSNKKLLDIQSTRKTLTIFDVLSNSNTVFRFAPAPSGYLHIGHFVPLVLNILLRSVTLHNGNKSKFILRIDDTNPNEDDFSSAIKDTMKNIMGDEFSNVVETRSSVMALKVIELINIDMNSENPHFYVDLNNKDTIKSERSLRQESVYRNMTNEEQKKLWENMLSGEFKNGVVRAKINMMSDNGNLRDPVMLRYVVNSNGESVMMPTYDLICPVLDSIDSMCIDSDNLDSDNKSILIAFRDGNYYDRLDQYYWIQNALNLRPTALVTFSRVNFENILLSKRKIKALVTSGEVDSWSDPRLMTIDGVFNRGLTLLGLLHFYWLSGHISVGNRVTSQDVSNLFAINDKVLSQQQNFIMDRMPITFEETLDLVPDFNSNTYMILSVFSLVAKKQKMKIINTSTITSTTISNILNNISDEDCHILGFDPEKSRPSDLINNNNNNKENNDDDLLKIPDMVHVKDLYCMKNRLITCNLRFVMDLMSDKNLTNTDLNNGDILKERFGLPANRFKCCSDIKVGDIIKINNFKDMPSEQIFHGYYYITDNQIKHVIGHDITNLIAIHIK